MATPYDPIKGRCQRLHSFLRVPYRFYPSLSHMVFERNATIILAKMLLKKKKKNDDDNEWKEEEPKGDECIVSPYLRQTVENL